MKNKELTIATDYYWPQRGGAEAVAQTLASNLRVDFNIQIITHGTCSSPSLFKRYLSVKEIPPIDPDGNPINLLRTGIIEKSCSCHLQYGIYLYAKNPLFMIYYIFLTDWHSEKKLHLCSKTQKLSTASLPVTLPDALAKYAEKKGSNSLTIPLSILGNGVILPSK